jgi:hypothetical protein
MQQSSPSRVSSAPRVGRYRVLDDIEGLLIKVEKGIEERPFYRRSGDRTGSMECCRKYPSAKPGKERQGD